MDFPTALIWLCQNPTGVIVRGTERCIGLTDQGAVWEFAAHKPGYCRLWVMDIVASDWEPLSREALEARAAAAGQSGQP
jgi:hypothetical protein